MSAKELIEWMAYARLEHDEAEQNAARQRAMAGATQARETARKF